MGASDEEGAAASEDPAGGELKYTDADVDRIVQKRLAKARAQFEKDQNKEDRDSEADRRLRELDARERRIAQAEIWHGSEDGLPESALDFLDYSSDEALEASREKLQALIEDLQRRYEKKRARGTTPKAGSGKNRGDGGIRGAFGL